MVDKVIKNSSKIHYWSILQYVSHYKQECGYFGKIKAIWVQPGGTVGTISGKGPNPEARKNSDLPRTKYDRNDSYKSFAKLQKPSQYLSVLEFLPVFLICTLASKNVAWK